MSHPPEPLLSHNEESMTEHRMSHAPETSLSSRELAIRLIQMPVDAVDRGEQLIDAWVRAREGEVRRNEASIWNSIRITAINLPGQAQIEARNRIIELKSVTVTARKQLEEKL